MFFGSVYSISAAMILLSGAMATPIQSHIANHNGGQRDLYQGWGNAKVCTVYSRTETHCFDTIAEDQAFEAARKAVNSPTDVHLAKRAASACPAGWGCVWEDQNFSGRMLRFHDTGRQDLPGFHNKVTSAFNNRGGSMELIDDSFRTLMPDRHFTLGAHERSSNVGDFNDSADAINLH
ncbi:hypothetical protein HKX48_008043 [Thoreauomyces humboldtii]|nr:hypothetical protein HKX48_008043 [Thoreauomyces humboldtii]